MGTTTSCTCGRSRPRSKRGHRADQHDATFPDGIVCAVVNRLFSGRCVSSSHMGTVKRTNGFNAQAFLDSAGLSKKIVEFARSEVIFSQGDCCESVMYIQAGGVKLSVLSKT